MYIACLVEAAVGLDDVRAEEGLYLAGVEVDAATESRGVEQAALHPAAQGLAADGQAAADLVRVDPVGEAALRVLEGEQLGAMGRRVLLHELGQLLGSHGGTVALTCAVQADAEVVHKPVIGLIEYINQVRAHIAVQMQFVHQLS